MEKRKKIIKVISEYLVITLGCFIAGVAIDIFLVPFRIAPGGIAGISTVLSSVTNGIIPVGVAIIVLNIPLFLIGMKLIGKRFIIRTMISTFMFSAFIDLLRPLTDRFVELYLGNPSSTVSNSNLLLYCVFGGVIMGTGVGIVFRAGATTGGTDLAALIVRHYIPHVSVGKILMVIDGLVVVFAAIAFKSFLLGLYAIVTIFLSAKMIDTILVGINFAKAVFIISNNSDIISQKIMKEIDRGVTGLKGKGMYTGTDKEVLLCVLDHRQIPRLKILVKEVDPDAFVIMTDIREVYGEGFISRN